MKIITLTYINHTIQGKFDRGDDDLLFILDTSLGAFNFNLPDLKECINHTLMFKNLSANTATLNTVNGQYIDYSGVSLVLIPYKRFYSIVSNRIDKWISLETNT